MKKSARYWLLVAIVAAVLLEFSYTTMTGVLSLTSYETLDHSQLVPVVALLVVGVVTAAINVSLDGEQLASAVLPGAVGAGIAAATVLESLSHEPTLYPVLLAVFAVFASLGSGVTVHHLSRTFRRKSVGSDR